MTWALASAATACATVIPRSELDRCRLGVADGNDSFAARQGAACRMIAARLVRDDRQREAIGFARRACELEDAAGCGQYLALVRGQPALAPDELSHARSMGEKACAGMIVGTDRTDSRPALCARTAELYRDLEPRSEADAAHLYARACKLGDDRSCERARSLGLDPQPEASNAASVPTAIAPALRPTTKTSASNAPLAAPCHEMRSCVAFDVNQRNSNEVVAALANRCDRRVTCIWCPARGGKVDKAGCRSGTVAPGESRAGREQGLWYEDYDAIAYECMDANDEKSCFDAMP